MANACRPKIGIIPPTYGHPVSLTEAIEFALVQQSTCDVVVLIVSDGCRWQETDVASAAYSSAAKNTFYIRKANGGPGSARNCGIEFLLNNWPEIEAIFFLDADNRLRDSTHCKPHTTLWR